MTTKHLCAEYGAIQLISHDKKLFPNRPSKPEKGLLV